MRQTRGRREDDQSGTTARWMKSKWAPSGGGGGGEARGGLPDLGVRLH